MANKRGFTLLELLVVVGILAALVALALPFYQDYVNQSKLTAAAADLQTFKKALAMYDQLEAVMFNTTKAVPDTFLTLIGKYLQDFRTADTQTNPKDPWGNDYILLGADGTIVSRGPNGTQETTSPMRFAGGDDIAVTWKPLFFLSSAKRISARTIELVFTRKVTTIDEANIVLDTPATIVASSKQKISDSAYRFSTNVDISVGDTVTLTTNTVIAQDGKGILATEIKPVGNGETANTAVLY